MAKLALPPSSRASFLLLLLAILTRFAQASIRLNPPSKFAVVTWQSYIPRRAGGGRYVMNVSQECESDDSAGCRGSMMALDLLRISRLFNPDTSFYLLINPAVLDDNTYYRRELESINIKIRNSSYYRREGSRAAQYDALHYARPEQGHPPEMLSRFCEMADMAKDEGLDRLLTIDADMGLFIDVKKIFAPYKEDVVSPHSRSSQIVLWSTAALNAYCDGLINIWKMDETPRTQLLVKYNANISFNDMTYLGMFLDNDAKGLSSAILLSEAASPRNPFPRLWMAALTALNLRPELDKPGPLHSPYNRACLKFQELLVFKDVWWSAPLPVPVLRDLYLPLPIVHFQQHCKGLVHMVYRAHYQVFS